MCLSGFMVQCLDMDAGKEWTLNRLGEMMERGFKAVAEDVADIKTEMMEQFEHVEKQFSAIDARLRDMAADIMVIHRRIERLEELGASNAGFAKEIDHLLMRVSEN